MIIAAAIKLDGHPQQFMDRIKAGEHAAMEGQVTHGKANIQHEFNQRIGLFSEDLW